tara:strand:+ start:6744 stop:7619 length:876 start_codon:yes stop_codon:yes gene_type:complete
MNIITTHQNEVECIDRLAAQRFAYAKAKQIFIVRISISTLFAVFGTMLMVSIEETKLYIAIAAIFYTMIDIFLLRNIENTYRRDGAKIQELFDTGLFGLEWNHLVAGSVPENEKVCLYNQQYRQKNDIENLFNWYPGDVAELSLEQAALVCQRTNIWWDVTLRQKMFWLITFGLLGLTFMLFIFFHGSSHLLLTVIVTLLPLYEVLCDYARSQYLSISKIKELQSKIEERIERVTGGESVLQSQLRTIQDEIFRHRESCLFVPDWFYFFFRGKQEEQMNYAASHYVSRFRK